MEEEEEEGEEKEEEEGCGIVSKRWQMCNRAIYPERTEKKLVHLFKKGKNLEIFT